MRRAMRAPHAAAIGISDGWGHDDMRDSAHDLRSRPVEVHSSEEVEESVANREVPRIVVFEEGRPCRARENPVRGAVAPRVPDLQVPPRKPRTGSALDLTPHVVDAHGAVVLAPATGITDPSRRLEGHHPELQAHSGPHHRRDLVKVLRGDGHVVRQIEADTMVAAQTLEMTDEAAPVLVEVGLAARSRRPAAPEHVRIEVGGEAQEVEAAAAVGPHREVAQVVVVEVPCVMLAGLRSCRCMTSRARA